ncbi:MAG: precorrin-6A reductase [Methanobacteriaceae archaeon]|nr:precorrin-6A reductase [Methanobacteriaceae archaeon]
MNILVMAGTKDAVNIIKMLSKSENEYSHHNNSLNILATTTTPYGADLAKNAGASEVISQPMPQEELEDLIEKRDIGILIDATHPFAAKATENAIGAKNKCSIKYIRYERPSIDFSSAKGIHRAISFEEAGKIACKILKKNKNVLHLAGVSTIKQVLKYVPREHLVVRILPNTTSIKKCDKIGLLGSNIIAMQGVFSIELNQAIMNEYDAGVIISKESGKTGGVLEKVDAALKLGLDVVLVIRPEIKELNNEIVVNNLKELDKLLKSIFIQNK